LLEPKGCGNAGLWTAMENQMQVFHRRRTSPWKSLGAFPHSRSPGRYRMENWKSKNRIPTFPRSVFSLKKSKTKGALTSPVTLVLQAHLWIRKD